MTTEEYNDLEDSLDLVCQKVIDAYLKATGKKLEDISYGEVSSSYYGGYSYEENFIQELLRDEIFIRANNLYFKGQNY